MLLMISIMTTQINYTFADASDIEHWLPRMDNVQNFGGQDKQIIFENSDGVYLYKSDNEVRLNLLNYGTQFRFESINGSTMRYCYDYYVNDIIDTHSGLVQSSAFGQPALNKTVTIIWSNYDVYDSDGNLLNGNNLGEPRVLKPSIEKINEFMSHYDGYSFYQLSDTENLINTTKYYVIAVPPSNQIDAVKRDNALMFNDGLNYSSKWSILYYYDTFIEFAPTLSHGIFVHDDYLLKVLNLEELTTGNVSPTEYTDIYIDGKKFTGNYYYELDGKEAYQEVNLQFQAKGVSKVMLADYNLYLTPIVVTGSTTAVIRNIEMSEPIEKDGYYIFDYKAEISLIHDKTRKHFDFKVNNNTSVEFAISYGHLSWNDNPNQAEQWGNGEYFVPPVSFDPIGAMSDIYDSVKAFFDMTSGMFNTFPPEIRYCFFLIGIGITVKIIKG